MGTFKIDDATVATKVNLVDGDLIIVADSEDVVGVDKVIKKTSMLDLKGYIGPSSGGGVWTAKYLTSSYTIINADEYTLYICDTTAGGFTVTLPALSANQNERYIFIKISDNSTVTIQANGTDEISGADTGTSPRQFRLTNDSDRAELVAINSRWETLSIKENGQFRAEGYTGYGSGIGDTNNLIFTTLVDDNSSFMTNNFTTQTVTGLVLTTKKDGLYQFNLYGEYSAATCQISIVGSVGPTNSYAKGEVSSSHTRDTISFLAKLDAGDTIHFRGQAGVALSNISVIAIYIGE